MCQECKNNIKLLLEQGENMDTFGKEFQKILEAKMHQEYKNIINLLMGSRQHKTSV